MRGLTKPLDYEKGKHRDNALKPDYRESFSQPVVQNLSKPRGPLSLFKATSTGIYKTKHWYTTLAKNWKEQIHREIRRITNRHPFLIDGKKLAFKWKLQDFATANSLSHDRAAKLLPGLKADALERRSLLERRLERAELRRIKEFDPQQGIEVEKLELQFGTQDIQSFFKFTDTDLEQEFFRQRDAQPQGEPSDNQGQPPA